jgi:DisA bacterial checkpoint controller nucleotide-binding
MAQKEPRVTIVDRRKTYLRAELANFGIDIRDPSLLEALVDELYYCLYSEAHENKIANYGAIVTRRAITEYDIGSTASRYDLGTLETNRLAADGVSSFLWLQIEDTPRNHRPRLVSFREPRIVDELQAFTMRDLATRQPGATTAAQDFFIIRRTNRATSLLTPQGIVHLQQNVWSVHPYQYDFALDAIVDRKWHNDTLTDLSRKIARLAVHLLSPKHIGGTLILLVDDKTREPDIFDFGTAISFPADDDNPFTLGQSQCHRLLASIMEQVDGCVLIRRDGTVSKAKVWLTISPDEESAVPSTSAEGKRTVGGSRQLSARRASRFIVGVVVTVSSDGPVRAYLDGDLILSTVPDEGTPLSFGVEGRE